MAMPVAAVVEAVRKRRREREVFMIIRKYFFVFIVSICFLLSNPSV